MCPKLRKQDSNLQRPESESGALPIEPFRNNAVGGLRTHDLQIKSLLLFQLSYNSLVLPTGVEPASLGLKGRCISALPRKHNGLGRHRTAYAEIFSLSLYRLSYKPSETRMGFEPTLPELQSGAFPAWLPCLTTALGIEPRLPEPKSCGLPLPHAALCSLNRLQLFHQSELPDKLKAPQFYLC